MTSAAANNRIPNNLEAMLGLADLFMACFSRERSCGLRNIEPVGGDNEIKPFGSCKKLLSSWLSLQLRLAGERDRLRPLEILLTFLSKSSSLIRSPISFNFCLF